VYVCVGSLANASMSAMIGEVDGDVE
jgi:hypothetical protein